MRISDWSSDVCSSDLEAPEGGQALQCNRQGAAPGEVDGNVLQLRKDLQHAAPHDAGDVARIGEAITLAAAEQEAPVRRQPVRSEEHTSELQSLMRISYAVFCLKKKT